MRKFIILRRRTVATIHLVASSVGLVSCAAPGTNGQDWLSGVKVSRIVAVADADFQGSTYATGQLRPAADPARDTLMVLDPKEPSRRGTLEVSNSVTAPPEVLALSPDARFAYVVERLGPRSAGLARVADLPAGTSLVSVDISDPTALKVVDRAVVGPSPESVRASPDGSTLLVTANTADDALAQLVPVRDGRFGPVTSIGLRALDLRGLPASAAAMPRAGRTVSFGDWHPSGSHIALNMNLIDRVAFFSVEKTSLALSQWGEAIATQKDPFVGRFTPDGRHYLTADWGRNFAATTLDTRLPAASSQVSVIRLGDPSVAAATHARVQSVESDRSSEGLAISRDGAWVATVNMRETAVAPNSPRFVKDFTVSLFSFNASAGRLTKVEDIALPGVLPEGASFDSTGDHLLVTVFAGHKPGDGESGIEVLRLDRSRSNGGKVLTRVGRIPTPPGVHHVEVAR